MSLKDDLATAVKPKSGPKCLTCTWFETLNADDQAAFNEYVSDPDHNRAMLYRVISTKWAFTGCESSLKYHLIHRHIDHGTC